MCDFSDHGRLCTISNITPAVTAQLPDYRSWVAPARSSGTKAVGAVRAGGFRTIQHSTNYTCRTGLLRPSWTRRRVGTSLYALRPQWVGKLLQLFPSQSTGILILHQPDSVNYGRGRYSSHSILNCFSYSEELLFMQFCVFFLLACPVKILSKSNCTGIADMIVGRYMQII